MERRAVGREQEQRAEHAAKVAVRAGKRAAGQKLAKVQLEWTLVTMAYNLKRLATLGLGTKLAVVRA